MNSSYAGKKIVVTGGAGFIGSHITEALVAQGAQVFVIDNLTTGSLGNLTSVASNITFIEGTILDKKLCLTHLENAYAVFHLAAEISVPASLEDPYTCYNTNILGTTNLLEAARINALQRFVFSSSCAVYGNQTKPCREDMVPNPLSPYASSKLIGEQLCQNYSKFFNVPTVCLRYFNVYGPRQNPNGPYAGVVAQFRNRMEKNEPITLYGDGNQSRDFVPVQQVVEANLQLAQLPDTLCTGTPINVGTGKTSSINDLFIKLKGEFPRYVHSPDYKPARSGDIVLSQADCSTLLQLQTSSKKTIPTSSE